MQNPHTRSTSKGGIASLASKGRNGDNTLVHMTHDEVAALQRLAKSHGTSLTINPETGLPEAFSLNGLLPMLGGAAGMMFGIPPMVTAAAIGGLQAAATGDIGKGLQAGLGAYGGAGLAGGFMGGAAGAGADVAKMSADQFAAHAATGVGDTAAVMPAATSGVNAGADVANMSADQYANYAAAGGEGAAAAPPTSLMDTAGANWDKVSGGIKGLGTEQGRDAYMASMGGGSGMAKTGLQALAPALMWGNEQKGNGAPAPAPGHIRRYTLDRNQTSGGDRAGGRGERRYFDDQWTPGEVTAIANGGIVGLAAGGVPGFKRGGVFGGMLDSAYNAFHGGDISTALRGDFTGLTSGEGPLKSSGIQELTKDIDPMQNKNANGKEVSDVAETQGLASFMPDSYASTEQYSVYDPTAQQYYANGGGIMALGQGGTLGSYSDGGQLLRGPGDGVSDSIPATINGEQPAKLADNEFVIPARIVSELGNGSSEAGSRKLYAMLERVQKARSKTVGKGKVAVDSKADRHLPA
jgi:hypothetical protein